MTSLFTPEFVKQTALDCGFDIAGIASAAPAGDYARYREWIAAGMAGEMAYLTDHRGRVRANPQNLLPAAKTVLCVGKIYNTPHPYSTEAHEPSRAWISRYAWGRDYHDSMREGLSGWWSVFARRLPLPSNRESAWIRRRCSNAATRGWPGSAGLGGTRA